MTPIPIIKITFYFMGGLLRWVCNLITFILKANLLSLKILTINYLK